MGSYLNVGLKILGDTIVLFFLFLNNVILNKKNKGK